MSSISARAQGDDDALIARAEELCLSPLKAIANPKMLSGLALKKNSTFKPADNFSSPETISTKKSSMQSSDFKIKKRVGAENTR